VRVWQGRVESPTHERKRTGINELHATTQTQYSAEATWCLVWPLSTLHHEHSRRQPPHSRHNTNNTTKGKGTRHETHQCSRQCGEVRVAKLLDVPYIREVKQKLELVSQRFVTQQNCSRNGFPQGYLPHARVEVGAGGVSKGAEQRCVAFLSGEKFL